MSVQPELARLASHVGAAVSLPPEAMAREVQAALRDAIAKNGWLPPERRRASHENYARHLLHGDRQGRFSILSIVWDQGQASPIHGHHCWCAVGVYLGALTESLYGGEAGTPVVVESRRRDAGTLSFDGPRQGIHRLGNDSGSIAISLHVYGVAQDRISTGVNRVIAVNRER